MPSEQSPLEKMAWRCGLLPPRLPTALTSSHRRAGTTTTQMLQALVAVEEGETVLFACDGGALTVYRRMLDEMASAAGVDPTKIQVIDSRVAERCSRGSGAALVFDHYQARR